jgi:hypothetical protein
MCDSQIERERARGRGVREEEGGTWALLPGGGAGEAPVEEHGRRGDAAKKRWSGPSSLTCRDESGVDNFRIRSDSNPNYADVEKSF